MKYRLRCAALIVVVLRAVPLWAQQGEYPAPPERMGYTRLTPADTVVAFLRSLDASKRIGLSTLALSAERRPILCARVRLDEADAGARPKVRILIFAQQHGDEPSGKEALLLFLSRAAAGEYDALLEAIDLFVIPQMNPDGAERGERRTAEGLDMNRAHLLLNIPQVKGLHDLFRAEQPEVTLDIHEYASYSGSWTDHGMMKRGDVQIGTLTNLNVDPALRRYERETVLPFIRETVERSGFSCNEYIVGNPGGRIRHSTTAIDDGRQSFGILQTLSFIQEGRKWRSLEEELGRRTRSQCAAVEALCAFTAAHAEEIRELVRSARERGGKNRGKTFYGMMEHASSSPGQMIPVTRLPGGLDTLWEIARYHGSVVPLDSCLLPASYVVRNGVPEVQTLLKTHGIESEEITASRQVAAQEYDLSSPRLRFIEEDSLSVPDVRLRELQATLEPGDLLVPVDQWAGLLAATMLEPTSAWGLLHSPPFRSLARARPYPILRIPVSSATTR